MNRYVDLLFAPWEWVRTVESIERIVDASNDDWIRDARGWRTSKITELSFIGLTSAIVANISVPMLLEDNRGTRGVWYAGFIIALFCVSLAVQQVVALYRLGDSDSSMGRIRDSFQRPGFVGGRPRRVAATLWQTPAILLNISIVLFVVGSLIRVYGYWGESVTNIVLTSVALAFSVGVYAFSWFSVFESFA